MTATRRNSLQMLEMGPASRNANGALHANTNRSVGRAELVLATRIVLNDNSRLGAR